MLNQFFLWIAIRLFLSVLHEDEYQILMHQRMILKPFSYLLATIYCQEVTNTQKDLVILYADTLYKGGNIYRRIGTKQSLAAALLYHQKALEWRKLVMNEYALDIGHSYISLGAAHNESKGKENNAQAIEYYHKAVAIFEWHGDAALHLKASAFNNVANAYRDLDDANIPIALEYQNQALALFLTRPLDENSKKELGKIHYNVGVNYHRLGGKENLFVAIFSLNKAKDIFSSLEDQARLAITLSYMGEVYSLIGKEYIPVAIEHLEKALAIQKKIYGLGHPEVSKTEARLKKALSTQALYT